MEGRAWVERAWSWFGPQRQVEISCILAVLWRHTVLLVGSQQQMQVYPENICQALILLWVRHRRARIFFQKHQEIQTLDIQTELERQSEIFQAVGAWLVMSRHSYRPGCCTRPAPSRHLLQFEDVQGKRLSSHLQKVKTEFSTVFKSRWERVERDRERDSHLNTLGNLHSWNKSKVKWTLTPKSSLRSITNWGNTQLLFLDAFLERKWIPPPWKVT